MQTAALPSTKSAFCASASRFKAWLVERGSAVLAPTNEYEVLRFIGAKSIAVIYSNQAGRITSWQGGADEAWRSYKLGLPWRGCQRGNRGGSSKRDRMFITLAERDGASCMYCRREIGPQDFTIEHILSITHGGGSHPANLGLACEVCNNEASHMSVREKVELAIRKRVPVQDAG